MVWRSGWNHMQHETIGQAAGGLDAFFWGECIALENSCTPSKLSYWHIHNRKTTTAGIKDKYDCI